jgi:hypothetical protein
MRIEGAIIREQGQVFAIVVVKQHVVENSPEANRAIHSFMPLFPGLPVVLAAQVVAVNLRTTAGATSPTSWRQSIRHGYPGKSTPFREPK